MSAITLLLPLLLILPPSALAGGHDYGQALSKSLLFFEAQRSGYLPHNQRVNWRANSGLQDGKASGVTQTQTQTQFAIANAVLIETLFLI